VTLVTPPRDPARAATANVADPAFFGQVRGRLPGGAMSRFGLLTLALLLCGCPSHDKHQGDTDSDSDVSNDDSSSAHSGTIQPDTDVTQESGAVDTDTLPGGTGLLDTDTVACHRGEVRDCNDECYAQILVGDHYCDHGPAPKADFDCEDFGFDGGDCDQ